MKAMRFAARALVVGILMVCCRGAVAAEPGSSWWPFGHHDDAAAAQSPSAGQSALPPAVTVAPQTAAPTAGAGPVAHEAQMPTTPSDDGHWMLNTPKKKVSWPSLHMPKSLSSKSATTTKPEASKNKWVDKAPVTPKTSPMQSVKKGANSVAEGTKSAWHKTVAAVTPSSSAKKTPKVAAKPAPQVASRETSPPFWKKMFGAKEPAMQQPQTVPQWMAQKRVDP
jgi:hypothetical protein